MAAIKIQKFLGEAPKIAPEQLPDAAAQSAVNTKFPSGDLVPYRSPVMVPTNGGTTLTTETVFALQGPNDQEVLLVWDKDVDAVASMGGKVGEEYTPTRVYYTGDGAPKVSDSEMAVQTGTPPYPDVYYLLGLPLPDVALSASALGDVVLTTTLYERDSSGRTSLSTHSAHNYRDGDEVTVTGFPDALGLNVTSTRITVENDTTFFYYSYGDILPPTASAAGRVQRGGVSVPRSYVYTWITPWGEESIPSEATTPLYIREGQTARVADIPLSGPAGNYFIRGVRLYRSLTTTSGTRYFRVRALWFPTTITSVARVSGVVTATLEYPHNLVVGDRVKIYGIGDASFNGEDLQVSVIVDRYSFSFTQAGSDTTLIGALVGVLYHDISEVDEVTGTYWGASGSSTFDDIYGTNNLITALPSETYEAPPEDLVGLTEVYSNIFAGFVGDTLYFSEPGLPHAWPRRYALSFGTDIVAVAEVSGYILVLTESYPYRVSGTEPEIMSYARIDTLYPCVSKRSVVNMGYGVVYATHGGLALYSPASGMDLVTKYIFGWDSWGATLDPSSIYASYHRGKYVASHTGGMFLFERDDKVGGYFARGEEKFRACWLDAEGDRLYYVSSVDGGVYEWDPTTQPFLVMSWKSKTITTKEYMNIGAARVITDQRLAQTQRELIQQYNEGIPTHNEGILDLYTTPDVVGLGVVNGPFDILSSGVPVVSSGAVNATVLNGDPFLRVPLAVPDSIPVVFTLWVNGEQIYQASISSNTIFRLPSGYRADTFEVSVSGAVGVKAIHLGETPYSLREIG